MNQDLADAPRGRVDEDRGAGMDDGREEDQTVGRQPLLRKGGSDVEGSVRSEEKQRAGGRDRVLGVGSAHRRRHRPEGHATIEQGRLRARADRDDPASPLRARNPG